MKKATIEFSASLVVYQDDEEWEGDEMSDADASGWVHHLLARGDKHAGNYLSYAGQVSSITYEDVDDED